MIRYKITRRELLKRIEEESPGFLADAKAKTENFKRAKKYDERTSTWGKIKPVFMRLQNFKCAYCERILEGEERGKIEHDVEHYRPKNAVRKWPRKRRTRNRGEPALEFPFPTGKEDPRGYYLLAYNVFNYLTACKTCNSILKSNYFPIAGRRGDLTEDVRALNLTEKPLLVYPLGTIDDDPKKILKFEGIFPQPVAQRGYRNQRAQVLINFFELDQRREVLIQGRFRVITAVWFALSNEENGPDPRSREIAREAIQDLLSDGQEHANCARSFIALFEEDPDRAYEYYTEARRYLKETRGAFRG